MWFPELARVNETQGLEKQTKKKDNTSSAASIIDGLLAQTHFIIKALLFGREFVFGEISGGRTDGEANQRL